MPAFNALANFKLFIWLMFWIDVAIYYEQPKAKASHISNFLMSQPIRFNFWAFLLSEVWADIALPPPNRVWRFHLWYRNFICSENRYLEAISEKVQLGINIFDTFRIIIIKGFTLGPGKISELFRFHNRTQKEAVYYNDIISSVQSAILKLSSLGLQYEFFTRNAILFHNQFFFLSTSWNCVFEKKKNAPIFWACTVHTRLYAKCRFM